MVPRTYSRTRPPHLAPLFVPSLCVSLLMWAAEYEKLDEVLVCQLGSLGLLAELFVAQYLDWGVDTGLWGK